MRRKLVTVAAAGVLGLSGIAVAGPVLAATGATGAAAAVTSRVDAIKSALSGLVKDGTLTQAQADKVATTLDKAGPAAGLGPRGFGPRGFGPGGHGPFGHGPGGDLGTAATTLKMTEANLRTALESGKSLAAIAKTQGVPVQTLSAALVKAERQQIEAAVTAGRLTRAQADRFLKDVTTRVTDRVNNTRPWGPRHGFDGRPGPGAAPRAPGAPAPSTTAPAAPAPTQTS